MRPFSIIVAFDQDYGIGLKNQLPWRLSADLKRFKEITMRTSSEHLTNAVIMGRKTWESLPARSKPLPGRLNVVLTQQLSYPLPEGVVRAAHLDEALVSLGKHVEHVFVIGGAQLYRLAIDHPLCQSLYITHIQGKFSCDTFFPPIKPHFMLIEAGETISEQGISFQFCRYIK